MGRSQCDDRLVSALAWTHKNIRKLKSQLRVCPHWRRAHGAFTLVHQPVIGYGLFRGDQETSGTSDSVHVDRMAPAAQGPAFQESQVQGLEAKARRNREVKRGRSTDI